MQVQTLPFAPKYMKVATQKQSAFYKLYESFKANPERFVPTWEFLGEMYVKELDKWVMLSYKCPTRLTDIFQENPDLLERKEIRGKSGANYYGYRFKLGASPANIKDPIIKKFYERLKAEALANEVIKRADGIKTARLSKCCGAPTLEGSNKCSVCGMPDII